MHADVVTHPNAVVVEIVGAPVAPLAVLRILQHMRIAYVAVELIVGWVEVNLGEFVLFCHSGQPFQGSTSPISLPISSESHPQTP